MENKHKNISKLVLLSSLCFFLLAIFPLQSKRSSKVLGLQSGAFLRGLPNTQQSDFNPTIQAEIDLSEIDAESFIVFERQSGKIILEKNPHQKLQIASITKLLTADLAINKLDLTKNYEFNSSDKINVSPTAGISVGDMISGQDLIISMLVGSANDSAKKLGSLLEKTYGMDVAEQMNLRAKELGMEESHFSNALGFDDSQNYSTGHDVYLLVNESLKHGLFDLISRNKVYKFSGIKGNYSVKATNKLVSKDSNIYAIKTGNTPDALGAMVSRSSISGKDIVFIVLKSNRREQDTIKLRELVVRSFNW